MKLKCRVSVLTVGGDHVARVFCSAESPSNLMPVVLTVGG